MDTKQRQSSRTEMLLGSFAAFFLALGAIAAVVGFTNGTDPVGPMLLIGISLGVAWIVATAIQDRRS